MLHYATIRAPGVATKLRGKLTAVFYGLYSDRPLNDAKKHSKLGSELQGGGGGGGGVGGGGGRGGV